MAFELLKFIFFLHFCLKSYSFYLSYPKYINGSIVVRKYYKIYYASKLSTLENITLPIWIGIGSPFNVFEEDFSIFPDDYLVFNISCTDQSQCSNYNSIENISIFILDFINYFLFSIDSISVASIYLGGEEISSPVIIKAALYIQNTKQYQLLNEKLKVGGIILLNSFTSPVVNYGVNTEGVKTSGYIQHDMYKIFEYLNNKCIYSSKLENC